VVAEVEVVVLGIADNQETDNGVNDGLSGRVLAKVLGLVLAPEALGLVLGSGTTGELLVEGDDALHGDSIGGTANGLRFPSKLATGPELLAFCIFRQSHHHFNFLLLRFPLLLPVLPRCCCFCFSS